MDLAGKIDAAPFSAYNYMGMEPPIRAEELHAVGRMNGLGAYVKTKDAFFHMPRMMYGDWKEGNYQRCKQLKLITIQ